jgi:predicted HTH domain antitoxin
MATQAEIREEARKVRRLRLVVDLVMSTLAQSDLSLEEAAELAASARQYALQLFPDKGPTYDLIYRPRFQRLLAEKYKMI